MTRNVIEMTLYDIEVYLNIIFCAIIVLYSIVYLRNHSEAPAWSWIKRWYIVVGIFWGTVYIYIGFIAQFEVFPDVIVLNITRLLITFTLASLAAGSILRVRAVGITGKLWHNILKKNGDKDHGNN